MKGRFIGLPIRASSFDGLNVRLLQCFAFVRPNGERINVPMGSESDGASTPPVLWAIALILVFIPPFGRYWPASVLHDYLYRYTHRPKWECDLILREGMEALEVAWLIRWLIYGGVRYGGWHSLKQDRAGQHKKKTGVHVRVPWRQ